VTGAARTSLFHRKSVSLDALRPDQRLKPTLGWWHLIPLGVGAIVGTGIYTLIGVGANLAGPGVIASFLVEGAICACAAPQRISSPARQENREFFIMATCILEGAGRLGPRNSVERRHLPLTGGSYRNMAAGQP